MNSVQSIESGAPQVQRSLQIGVIGLGQAGGLIAWELAQLGYSAIAFNTSETDIRSLNLPGEDKFLISRKGSDGAGRDRKLGAAMLRAGSGKILETVQKRLSKCDHLLICGGLAGGTGGNLGLLASILGELKVKVSAAAAIPRMQDGSVDKFNAAIAMGDLARAPVNSIILVDNDRAVKNFPSDSLSDLYLSANRQLAEEFDYFNRISSQPELIPLQGFDSEDYNKILSTRGLLIYGSGEIPLTEKIEDYSIIIDSLINENTLWPDGYDFGGAKAAAIVMRASKAYLSNDLGWDWGELVSALTGMTKGSACYPGIFQSPDNWKPRLSIIIAGMNFPSGVNRIIDSARIESRLMRTKLEREYSLDVSELDGLTYFDDNKDGRGKVKTDSIIDDLEDESEESDELQIDEVDFEALTPDESPDKQPVLERVPADSTEEDEPAVDESLVKKNRKTGVIFSLIFLAVIIVVSAYFIFQGRIFNGRVSGNFSHNKFSTPAQIKSGSFPPAVISIDKESILFFIIANFSESTLSLYNSQLYIVKNYNAVINLPRGGDESASIEGIGFPVSITAGRDLPPQYGPLAFALHFSVMDSAARSLKADTLWLHSYPDTPPEKYENNSLIIIAPEDIIELANFITLFHTPVIICNKSKSISPEVRAGIAISINKFLADWRKAWNDGDINDSVYLVCFHSFLLILRFASINNTICCKTEFGEYRSDLD
ncbi:MAG: hypothetical protein H8E87_03105 [FCB group bacterium]|nr:hypothetical protein [FCB group bacterium]